ncbi:MAG: lasso peptide biosynthesis B2 protein [Rhizomicrobium sp.]
MSIRRKLASFRRLPGRDRMMVCEAAVILGIARVLVLTRPFRALVPWLSRSPDSGSADALLIRRVRRAVTIAARNVPWNAVCLPQAMAAKAMLARRGHGSAFHLGATIENEKVSAHAWLTTGAVVVVGAKGLPGMSHMAQFG